MPKAQKRQPPSRNPAARAAFFEHVAEIERLLKGGRYSSEIVSELAFPGSVSQFDRYVARYLPEARRRGRKKGTPAPAQPVAKAEVQAPLPSPEPGRQPRRAIRSDEKVWDPANLDPAELFGSDKEEP